jgi:hypothetical protein
MAAYDDARTAVAKVDALAHALELMFADLLNPTIAGDAEPGEWG